MELEKYPSRPESRVSKSITLEEIEAQVFNKQAEKSKPESKKACEDLVQQISNNLSFSKKSFPNSDAEFAAYMGILDISTISQTEQAKVFLF